MRSLTLRVEDPQIVINGNPYSLRMTDWALYARAQEVLALCERLADAPATPAGVLSALGEVTTLLEQALGEGALGAISGGRPVSLPLAIEWLAALAREAAEHCANGALAGEE